MKKKWWFLGLFIVAGYVAWALLRPLPDLQPTAKSVNLRISSGSATLTWPTTGQAAVGIIGSDILETHGPQKPAPTASTAKIITALMVLRQKPISVGQQGPTITLTAADKALYDAYSAQQGSVVPVQAGEQISEYQMLEAMLLPSANNMADSLATWAYGSLTGYSAAANAYLKQLGLTDTTVGSDASGFAPTTVSTAHDMVKLGELVMQNPVLASIVSKTSTSDIPLVPVSKNVNFLLGTDGIIGVKTGNTDQAGGVFVAGARININQKPVTIVTALLDAPTLFSAMKFSLPLIQSAEANFKPITAIHANDVVGYYKQPWGGKLPVIASQDLTLTTWQSATLKATANLVPFSAHEIPSNVAILTVSDPSTGQQQTVPLKLDSTPTKPNLTWRLLHP